MPGRLGWALTGLVAILLLSACGSSVPSVTVTLPVLRAQLDNGLRLVLVPDKQASSVQVDVRYEVGSNEDPEGKAGLAHLVEYLMFQHHNGFSSAQSAALKTPASASPNVHASRYLDSYTSHESTHYSRRGANEDLRKMLRAEALRLFHRCKLIPKDVLEQAKESVTQGIRQREESTAGRARLGLLKAVYPEGHPYRRWLEGDAHKLSSITYADLCSFTEHYYVPSRAIVVVTGNVGHEELGAMVQELFGGIPRGKPAPLREVPSIALTSQRVRGVVGGEATTISLVWSLPRHFTDEYDYASLMKVAINRVWPSLLMAGKNCEPSNLYESGGKIAPALVVQVKLESGKSVEQCLEDVWSAASRTHEFLSLDGDMQERNRADAKLAFVESMDSMALKGDLAADGVQFDRRVDFLSEDGNYFYDYLERIDRIDAGRFRAYVEETLGSSKAVIFVAEGHGNKADLSELADP